MSGTKFDAVILGAGPAGSTAALNLAAHHRVVVVDRNRRPELRIGESLPSAARRLFDEMGLLESFLRNSHSTCFANRYVWGSAVPGDTDALFNPDGPGWHLDRIRFESWLRAVSFERGAIPLIPAQIESILFRDGRWIVQIQDGPTIEAFILIEASGRSASLARRLGASLRRRDRLICRWTRGYCSGDGYGAGLTHIEAVETGWWYTAPVPNGQRILGFLTDADLPAARMRNLLAKTRETVELNKILSRSQFNPSRPIRTVAANSSALEPPIGSGWLAVGDAALSLDPLSSQGLLNALFMGLSAAKAVVRHLAGDADALFEYSRIVARIDTAYRRNLETFYGYERRWPDSLFWQRRHQPAFAI
jgi:flavin-dependent dehydrogenase